MIYEAKICPIRYGLGVFGDRWSLLIIRDLMFKKKQRYQEFLEAGEGISTNILADRLVHLESAGIVNKSKDPTHGRKILYSLTEKGKDLMPMMLAMMDWSQKYDPDTEVPKAFIKRVRTQREVLQKELLQEIPSAPS